MLKGVKTLHVKIEPGSLLVTRTHNLFACWGVQSIAFKALLNKEETFANSPNKILYTFQHLRSFTFPHIQVSEVITLEPENFELATVDGEEETVMITPPCAHTGPGQVKLRLISHAVREGMVVSCAYYFEIFNFDKKWNHQIMSIL